MTEVIPLDGDVIPLDAIAIWSFEFVGWYGRRTGGSVGADHHERIGQQPTAVPLGSGTAPLAPAHASGIRAGAAVTPELRSKTSLGRSTS